jgi:hypothetical protein
MNDHDRREFLKITTAGALGLSAATIPLVAAASSPALAAPSNWPPLLLARRSRIQSLKVAFTTRLSYVDPGFATDKNSLWVLEGPTEMWFDSGRYRVVYQRGEFRFTEISVGERFVQKAEHGNASPEVLYEGPVTAERKPGVSLDRFMPTLKNRPYYDQGKTEVNGESCEILGQDNIRMFIASRSAWVLRLESFRGVTDIQERVDYLTHTMILGEDPFPVKIASTRFGAGGSVRTVLELLVHKAVVNKSIPESAFEFGGES